MLAMATGRVRTQTLPATSIDQANNGTLVSPMPGAQRHHGGETQMVPRMIDTITMPVPRRVSRMASFVTGDAVGTPQPPPERTEMTVIGGRAHSPTPRAPQGKAMLVLPTCIGVMTVADRRTAGWRPSTRCRSDTATHLEVAVHPAEHVDRIGIKSLERDQDTDHGEEEERQGAEAQPDSANRLVIAGGQPVVQSADGSGAAWTRPPPKAVTQSSS